ncbi:hypothetical protein [Streptomyces sp. RFCAC02]|uniref:hypothetical protein n=1 Tax=Streptomyces sp. RFCAC02 TaxID=2499143 RepID=UPI00101F208C|nr:hypothetical protein [Streptomyces sp. RFCAC02]
MSAGPAAGMPSAEQIVAMQDLGDRDRCRHEIDTASDERRDAVVRKWWACGLLSQRPGRADQYAAAHLGGGDWRPVGNAA